VRAGEFDWSTDRTLTYVPDVVESDDADAWQADDALFVPLFGTGSEVLGFLSVDEPFSGRRPTDDDLEVLSAMAAHVAVAVENAQAQAESARHNASVEHLLRVSAQLNGRSSAEETLSAVCAGISDALGFEKVMLALDEGDGRLAPRASAGWTAGQIAQLPKPTVAEMAPLTNPALAEEGCILLDQEAASEIAPGQVRGLYTSQRNGRGPHAWNRHWLVVPLYGREGAVTGLIWVDDPSEQLAAAVLLAETLDMRDIGTARHCETVGHYAERIALALGFPAARVARVRAAGVLHDIGKLGISDGILHKPGKLDDHEWAEMKRHPELGARILEHANLRDIAAWVRAHHERVDGRGYPAALAADEIPVEARILAVADAYEAMTADRPYRRALSAEVAQEELRRNAGGQFDPAVVDAFLGVLADGGAAAPETLVGVAHP
jgi:putative nucleotidyltransferase with HDIG domain